MNLRQRVVLRAVLIPAAVLAAVAVGLIGIEGFGLSGAAEVSLLAGAALLAFLLVIALLWRMEQAIGKQAQVAVRERSLVERQKAFDRLHSGVAKVRTQPWQARWLKLAEQRRISDAKIIAGWEQRYQELLAHPTRRGWADEALKGNFPSDAEIDYETHPHLLLTCVHLQPVESALRTAGIYCSALSPNSVVTFASLHQSALRRHFTLPGFVEWEMLRASASDPGTSSLVCRPCESRLQSGSGEPFPA